MDTLDTIRWYKNGDWGDIGYATPYIPQGRTHTNNMGIKTLVDRLGHNLFGVMHQPDVNSTAPPKLYYLVLLHKAIEQFRRLAAAKTVADNELDLRTTHVTPTPEPFKIFPVPYFRVRNPWAKRWCQLTLIVLSELIQHQDNVHSMSVHEDVMNAVNPFIDRIYQELAIEFFGKTKADVQRDAFVLTDADFKKYDPDLLFTATERVDLTAPLLWNKTEEKLSVLAEGIEAPLILPFLRQWPLNFSEQFTEPNAGASSPAEPTPGNQVPVTTADSMVAKV